MAAYLFPMIMAQAGQRRIQLNKPYSTIVSGIWNYLYAGTAGGVFRAPLSSFAGIIELQNDNIPLNIFPIPCNETLQITCDEPGTKTIEIYNTLGECIEQCELNNTKLT